MDTKHKFLLEVILPENSSNLKGTKLFRSLMAKDQLDDLRHQILMDGEDDFTPEQVNKMSPRQLVETRLNHNDIYGYADDIITWVLYAFGLGLTPEEMEKFDITPIV